MHICAGGSPGFQRDLEPGLRESGDALLENPFSLAHICHYPSPQCVGWAHFWRYVCRSPTQRSTRARLCATHPTCFSRPGPDGQGAVYQVDFASDSIGANRSRKKGDDALTKLEAPDLARGAKAQERRTPSLVLRLTHLVPDAELEGFLPPGFKLPSAAREILLSSHHQVGMAHDVARHLKMAGDLRVRPMDPANFCKGYYVMSTSRKFPQSRQFAKLSPSAQPGRGARPR